jgi:hypothetical protein
MRETSAYQETYLIASLGACDRSDASNPNLETTW